MKNLTNSTLTWILVALKQLPYEGLQQALVTSWSTALLLRCIHALPAAFVLFSSVAALFGFVRTACFWLCCVGGFIGGICPDVWSAAARARVILPGSSLTLEVTLFSLFMFEDMRDKQNTTSNRTSQYDLQQNQGQVNKRRSCIISKQLQIYRSRNQEIWHF